VNDPFDDGVVTCMQTTPLQPLAACGAAEAGAADRPLKAMMTAQTAIIAAFQALGRCRM
jgi:hypothetical protein